MSSCPPRHFSSSTIWPSAMATARLQLVQPVIEPAGESRPNVEVFAELAARLGIAIDELRQGDVGTLMHVAGALPDNAGEELLSRGITRGSAPAAPVQFADVFPRTPDGRVDLLPAALEQSAPLGLYRFRPEPAPGRYPLALILSRQRQDRLFHARGVADAAGPAPDSPARRRGTGPVDRRRGARLQRRGRDPLRNHRQPGREAPASSASPRASGGETR